MLISISQRAMLCLIFYLELSRALKFPENFENFGFTIKEPFTNGIRIKDVWDQKIIALDTDGNMRILFKEAINIWSETLSVRNYSDETFLLPRACDSTGFGFRNGRLCCLGTCAAEAACGSIIISQDLFDECRICTDAGFKVVVPQGAGLIRTNLLLYVYLGDKVLCETSDAHAKLCAFDDRTDRPLVAEIGICNHMIKYRNSVQKDIFLHEIAHALGLTTTAYAFLRHRDGSPRTPRNVSTDIPTLGLSRKGYFIPGRNTGMEIQIGKRTASLTVLKTAFYFTLPTLLQVARRIFDAPNLVSFPMEDIEIQGVESSHFDARVALGDLMTASMGEPTKITYFLLAFMYDTGWYDVSSAHAVVPTWGLLSGVEFVMKSCYEFVHLQRQKNKIPSPFCGWPEYNTPACLPDRTGYGLCDIVPVKPREYEAHKVDRPDMSAILSKLNYGGRHLQLNYCPIISDVRKEQLWYRLSNVCNQEVDQRRAAFNKNFAMEKFGTNSICLDHDRKDPWKVEQNGTLVDLTRFGASCHEYRCNRGKGLELIIGESSFTCPTQGGSIEIHATTQTSRLSGSVHCPICEILCHRNDCDTALQAEALTTTSTQSTHRKQTITTS